MVLSSYGVDVTHLILLAGMEVQLEFHSKSLAEVFLCIHYLVTGRRSFRSGPGSWCRKYASLGACCGHCPSFYSVACVCVCTVVA